MNCEGFINAKLAVMLISGQNTIKVQLTVHGMHHCMLKEDWKKVKSNEPGRQKCEKFLAVAEACKKCKYSDFPGLTEDPF